MARVQNGDADTPWHILIEADNYHALQLLEYCYAGQVDCIYIDPPYNTGARDWKYNNDYVDANDRWRHSKWLAMMKRRLVLAERLLRPTTGVLIVTIDEHEVHHLGCLLEKCFPQARRQLVTIVNNAAGVSQGGFYRVEEYAFFCFFGDAKPVPINDDLLSDENTKHITPIWFSLIRYGGINSLPSKRPHLVYPIAIDPERKRIVATGRTLKQRLDAGEFSGNLDSWKPNPGEKVNGFPVIWPFRENGLLSTWQLRPETLLELAKDGYVQVREHPSGPGGNRWSINYIKQGNRDRIQTGEIPVLGREEDDGPLILGEATRSVVPKTVWRRTKHDAGKWGSRTIREILGKVAFDYAKSPYAVMDTLATVVGDNLNALILDFFAGSGTTLHAVDLLNSADGGKRRCILVTNNEVSEDEANNLSARGLRPGHPEWEKHGICQSVTWPRIKYAILGRRDDGTELQGEYVLSKTTVRTKPRNFRQIGFIDPAALNTASRKKQLVALTDGIPQSLVRPDTAFIVSDQHTASILFDPARAEDWLAALEDKDHITEFYIVTPSPSVFEDLKTRVADLLGPIMVPKEEKRPMRDGFPANVEYFKLDFLEKDQVALGRQFREILPILWLRSGAVGPRPELTENAAIPDMLIPDQNRFAVLIDENRFSSFLRALEQRADITHVFIVTDSDDDFPDMAAQVNAPQVIQLYRDYLGNFMINKGHESL
jgi:adenine-specific DNA-methyltransferase